MYSSQNKTKNQKNRLKTSVYDLRVQDDYLAWRQEKLSNYPATWDESIVTLTDMANPRPAEISKIVNFCQKANMAIYQTSGTILPQTLEAFCSLLGLSTMETHRSAEKSGVVAIEQSTSGTKGGYIPYTNKPLSWHTDGYYNPPTDRIRAMVLHCERDASQGGINELLDPEIIYIRLRDQNPDYIQALQHPQALIVPANNDPRTPYRPDSVGPVFEIDNGNLHMRYSARARNIIWRDDAATTAAREALTEILVNDPLIVRHKLQSGQGVISNNVLHNRTGFIDASDANNTRLLYRIRYKERVSVQ